VISANELISSMIKRERAKISSNHPNIVPVALVDGLLDRLESAANGSPDSSTVYDCFEIKPIGGRPIEIETRITPTSKGKAVTLFDFASETGKVFILAGIQVDHAGEPDQVFRLVLEPGNGLGTTGKPNRRRWGRVRGFVDILTAVVRGLGKITK